MTQTTTLEANRRAYRFLLAFSGETPERFNRACRSLIEEYRDGEGEGDPTPSEWVRAALERAWDVCRAKGHGYHFERCRDNVQKILAGAS